MDRNLRIFGLPGEDGPLESQSTQVDLVPAVGGRTATCIY